MAYQLVLNQSSQLLSSYVGKWERCTYEFQPPKPFDATLTNRLIAANIAGLADQGSQLLHIKVWQDTSPFFHSNYRVEITATASPLVWWIIVGAVIALLLLLVVWQILEVIEGIIEKLPEFLPDISKVLWAIAGVGLVAIGGYVLVKRGTQRRA